MKVFLFGATGPTGQLVLNELLNKGYEVKALARDPTVLSSFSNPKLKVIKGDIFRIDSFQRDMADVECVISVLGTGSSVKRTSLYSEGGANILKSIKSLPKIKFITITSGGVQEDDPVIQNSFFYRIFGLWYFSNIYDDMKKWEKILDNNTDLNWICIRPTYLKDLPKTGKYRVHNIYAPEGGWKISRADLADFIVTQVKDNQYIHKKPVIAY